MESTFEELKSERYSHKTEVVMNNTRQLMMKISAVALVLLVGLILVLM